MSAVKSKRKFPEFETKLVEIEEKLEVLKEQDGSSESEIKVLKQKREATVKDIFSKLTPYQKVQLARHPMRPYTLDYIKGIFEDFIELHGDRNFGDDRAIVGGIARLKNETVIVIGHQKGRNVDESTKRNYAMPHPEGYRKALRLMKFADKFGYPIITFIDTPGAWAGIGAEERGQAEAIATNLKEMALLKVPIIVVVIGEGGSGGALAIGLGDRMLMLENAVYYVCTPEACGAILWRDSAKAPEAAANLKVTAKDLQKLGVIDEIVKEPAGGAHWDYETMFKDLRERLMYHVNSLKRTKEENLLKKRYDKFRHLGQIKI